MKNSSSTPISSKNPVGQDRMEGLQILRAVAALLVVFHHVLEELNSILQLSSSQKWLVLAGAAGVDIFFVISGFIMAHTTWDRFDKPRASMKFLIARVLRIYPLHLFCLSLILLLWFTGAGYRSLPVDGNNIIGSVLLLPIGLQLHGVTWTLVHEVIFYGLFSMILLMHDRRQALLTLCLTLVLMTMVPAMLGWSGNKYLTSPLMLEFMAGVLLAVLWNTRKRIFMISVAVRWLGVAAMIVWISVASHYFPANGTSGLASFWRILGWGVGAVGFVYFFLGIVASRGTLAHAMRWLGDRSYSLYLTHSFLMMALAVIVSRGFVVSKQAAVGLILAAIFGSIIAAAIAFRWVEQPLGRWGRRQIPRQFR